MLLKKFKHAPQTQIPYLSNRRKIKYKRKSYYTPLPSKINPNPDLPAAFIPFFRRIFFMAVAMKIHLKKNAAANGLELKERLQGLTATDVTHSRKSKAAILIFHI